MIHLGTQYYRPPFPNPRYWETDIRQMADSGLNTIQLWVVWAWVEAEPDKFRFDDYDRLVELAAQNGLDVVLSTIAAIHPYWIHRHVPGSEMVDNMGHKVVSSNRGECHFGLTPGGCIDHPGVWERMKGFLSAVVQQYREAPNLAGWDAWNELRWNVQADGLVCYCPYTINRFRAWLDARYGGLDGLNRAWERRYASWEDVFPGKSPDRPYTEMMAFQDFICWRAVNHAYARYDHIKALDPQRPVTVHGGQPTVLHGSDSYPTNTALHRGNDWFFADHIDGVGCSSFPMWGGREMDPVDFVSRIDFLTSAAHGKRIWLSELQGGRSNIGFSVAQSVDPASQQRWVWTGLASGADTILFWCWRDEVFGRESTGFGLAGNDGLAAERLAAMKKTGALLREHDPILRGFRPAAPEVGILFSPQAYYLYWSQEGTARVPLDGIRGYARALVRHNIPYLIVEENHLDRLEGLKLLFLPRSIVLDQPAARQLEAFVRAGGILFCESECGAFASNGIYRYPEDRYFAVQTGVREVGRRRLEGEAVPLHLDGVDYLLPAAQWITPLLEQGEAPGPGAPDLLVQAPLGQGKVIFCGSYLGDAYLHASQGGAAGSTRAEQFESFLSTLVRMAGVELPVRVIAPRPGHESLVLARAGRSEGRSMAFVFAPAEASTVELAFPAGSLGAEVQEILGGETIPVQKGAQEERIVVRPNEWHMAVLVSS